MTDFTINNTIIHKLYVQGRDTAWALVSKKIDMKENELPDNYKDNVIWIKLGDIDKIESYKDLK